MLAQMVDLTDLEMIEESIVQSGASINGGFFAASAAMG